MKPTAITGLENETVVCHPFADEVHEVDIGDGQEKVVCLHEREFVSAPDQQTTHGNFCGSFKV